MKSINPRFLSSALILLFLIMTIGLVYSLSIETNEALKEALQGKLIAVASTTASQIDGDSFDRIRPGDENTESFRTIQAQLLAVRAANPDIHYIYTMRKSGDAILYVVDADYGTDGEYTPLIGDIYPAELI